MKLTETICTAPAVYQFTLQADAAEFDAAIETIYQANKAKLTLDGYAAGEATREAIEAAHGAEYFYYEAINHLLAQGADVLLQNAIAAAGVTPLTAPDYDVTQCSKDGACVQVTIGVLPEVTLGQYKDLTLSYPRMQPEKGAVEGQLAHIHAQVAQKQGKNPAELPLDDAFVQQVSNCATLDELRDKLTASLVEFADAQSRRQGQFMLLEKIGKESTIDLPEYLLEKEFSTALDALTQHLQQHGVPFETYLAQQGKTKEQFDQEHHQAAVAALRAKLAAYTIAQQEGIAASEMEVESERIRLAAHYKKDIREFQAEHPAYLVKNDLILTRTIAFLEKNNTLTPAT